MEDVIPIVDIKTINIKNKKKSYNNLKEKQSESEILSYSLDEDDDKKTSKKHNLIPNQKKSNENISVNISNSNNSIFSRLKDNEKNSNDKIIHNSNLDSNDILNSNYKINELEIIYKKQFEAMERTKKLIETLKKTNINDKQFQDENIDYRNINSENEKENINNINIINKVKDNNNINNSNKNYNNNTYKNLENYFDKVYKNNYETFRPKNYSFRCNSSLKPLFNIQKNLKMDVLIKKKITQYKKDIRDNNIFDENKINKKKRNNIILDDLIPSHHKTEIYYYSKEAKNNNKSYSFINEEFKFSNKEKIDYKRKDNLLRKGRNNLIMPSNPFNSITEIKKNMFLMQLGD